MNNTKEVLTLTPLAKERIEQMFESDKDAKGKALRISVVAGSCSTFQYDFKYDNTKDDDTKLDYKKFSILLDNFSFSKLVGSTLDYKESFGSSGFDIKNPKVERSCGCGTSFELKEENNE